jgi:hypothetical protein
VLIVIIMVLSTLVALSKRCAKYGWINISSLTDKSSINTHKAEVHQPVDLLGRFIVVEIVEFGALSYEWVTLLFLMMSSSSSEPSSSSTYGLSGGFISIFTSFYQLTWLKKGCYLIWDQLLAPNRFFGSLSKRPVIKDFAFSLTFLGNFSLPYLMFL